MFVDLKTGFETESRQHWWKEGRSNTNTELYKFVWYIWQFMNLIDRFGQVKISFEMFISS